MTADRLGSTIFSRGQLRSGHRTKQRKKNNEPLTAPLRHLLKNGVTSLSERMTK